MELFDTLRSFLTVGQMIDALAEKKLGPPTDDDQRRARIELFLELLLDSGVPPTLGPADGAFPEQSVLSQLKQRVRAWRIERRFLKVARQRERSLALANTSCRTSLFPRWPRLWELLAFALPKKTRDALYEPGRYELLEDYCLTRSKYRTKWAKRWLRFCFALRTTMLFFDCWRVLLAQKGWGIVLRSLPERLHRWWTS